MEQLKFALEWIKLNWVGVLISLSALTAFLETVVRLTPTKSDDGAVKRIGEFIDFLLDFCKIPNVNKIQTFKAEPKSDAEVK